MFSLSVVCTLNTQLKLLPFKRYTVLRQPVNGNFNLTPTVYMYVCMCVRMYASMHVGACIMQVCVFKYVHVYS